MLAAVDAFLSPSALASAREWAAAEAGARGATLRFVTLPSAETQDPLADGHAVGQVGARSAELLIVGAAPNATTPAVLGSLPRSGRRRLACPVIVLRGCRSQPIRRIVVGVVGNGAATAALHWAVEEAVVHRADLVVVHAWQRHVGVGRSTWRDALDLADAHRTVDLAVRECAARSNGRVHGAVAEGDAAAVLVAASKDADLLVVGSRGQSGFTAMLFGPVATFLVGAAACPVALIDPHVG